MSGKRRSKAARTARAVRGAIASTTSGPCARPMLAASTPPVARRPLADTHPQLAAELHRTRNQGLDASSVSAGSGLRVWWRCATCGHEWQATITNRTNRVRPSGCPACAGKATPPERSLAARHPDLYAEWHGTRNGQLDPFALSPGSGRPAWWRCRACGHEWQARIESRTKHGTGCPACYAREAHAAGQRQPRAPAPMAPHPQPRPRPACH